MFLVGYQPNTKDTCEKICPTGYQSCLVPTCNCPKDQECEIVIRKDGCEYAKCTCVPVLGWKKFINKDHILK